MVSGKADSRQIKACLFCEKERQMLVVQRRKAMLRRCLTPVLWESHTYSVGGYLPKQRAGDGSCCLGRGLRVVGWTVRSAAASLPRPAPFLFGLLWGAVRTRFI